MPVHEEKEMSLTSGEFLILVYDLIMKLIKWRS